MSKSVLTSGRFYIYCSLALIFITYNFFFELEFGSLSEAAIETLVLYPMILLFLCLIYWSRKKIFSSKYVHNINAKNSYNKILIVLFVILIKGVVIAILSRAITLLAFGDDDQINAPFFDVLFFTIFLTVIVFSIFIYFFEEYVSSIKDKHQLAIELTSNEAEKNLAKYNSLKNQLNPHFLFNSFNSLMSLIPVDSNKAEKFVEELSNIYRYNLSKSDDLVVKLSEELEMISSYIHLQKIRFGEALIYSEQITLNKDKVLLPPMTLQVLIENAIKHNKATKAQPLTIKIFDDNNSIVVQNNLQLKKDFERGQSFGIGMNSLRSQLRVLTNDVLKVKEDDQLFTVQVPLINTELDD